MFIRYNLPMSVYLHDIPLSQAKERLRSALQEAGLWHLLRTETIPLDENALGRALAAPIWALQSSPHYHASAMDGFAIRAAQTNGAMPSAPLSLRASVEDPQAAYVDTGDPLPAWANAVIPIEQVEALSESGALAQNPRQPAQIRIRAAVTPWSNVRPLGEDIVATQLVLPAGHTLRPYDLGAVAAAGHVSILVAAKPRVAILPTGTELVPMGQELRPGDILEYNSLVMAAQVQEMGALPTRYPITPDNFEAICDRVSQAAQENDLVLLNAGSSAGSEDFSAQVVQKLGTLLVHGIAVRPGHPVILGLLRRPDGSQIPIVGVPGYPVSAALTVDIFVQELISCWLGTQPPLPAFLPAAFTRKTTSPAGDDDFVRVVVGKVGEKTLAAPIARGAGVITSLVRADGLVVIPSGVQGVEAGEQVSVRLKRPAQEIDQTIFCIGSHDVILDVMAQFLAGRGRRLVSSNVGSQAGLIALRRREAHLAGSHLLDPQTGGYNLAALRQYLPGVPVRLIGFVHRAQGLMVKKGNPKALTDLKDLARGDVNFINRQRGAGTRVLLDYHLNRLGIAPEALPGYAEEEYTHLGVAAAVASGRADCGLGLPAAAQALGVDFLPLFEERYDLVLPAEHAESPLLAPLLALLQDLSFREAVKRLPGYDTAVMGNVIAEIL